MLIDEKTYACAMSPGNEGAATAIDRADPKGLVLKTKALTRVRKWGEDGFKEKPSPEDEARYNCEGDALYESRVRECLANPDSAVQRVHKNGSFKL